jgi:hypothetical protein
LHVTGAFYLHHLLPPPPKIYCFEPLMFILRYTLRFCDAPNES